MSLLVLIFIVYTLTTRGSDIFGSRKLADTRLTFVQRCLTFVRRFKVNCNRLAPLFIFIWGSCSVIDLTEYCFPVTRVVLNIHNIPHHYSPIFGEPTSILEEIFAVLFSIVICLIPVAKIALLYALITSIVSVQAPHFNLVFWSLPFSLIWLFVLFNGLGVLTYYLDYPYVGHELIYGLYFASFFFSYVLNL